MDFLSKKDPRYASLAYGGWGHYVIPWSAIETWPRLGHVFQAGHNARNAVPTQVNEAETLVSIVAYADSMHKADFQQAAKAVSATSACKAYCDKLGVMAERFAGGP